MTGPAFDLRCHDSRTPWPAGWASRPTSWRGAWTGGQP